MTGGSTGAVPGTAPNTAKESLAIDADPSCLPMFGPAELRGRRRSTFTLRPAAGKPAVDLAADRQASAPPVTVVPSPAADDPRMRLVTLERPAAAFDDLDWSQVAALRSVASERLMRLVHNGEVDRAEQQVLGRRVIAELVEEETRRATAEGRAVLDRTGQARLCAAVFDALFRLGRLQPLVDNVDVENVIILGCDDVWVEYADGRLERGPAVADSDPALIEFLVFLASRSEVNARQFSESEPRLHLRLDGGARLAATAWVTPRPSVVIRRHRLREVTLDDLVRRGSLSAVAASFLAAAVRARRSIVVAGPQGAGKTTMVRALCAEIDPGEAIGTFETEYELHLHELKSRHPIVHAWEARPGGELQPNGRRAGEFTLDDALYDSYRFNLSRQIVGEVRGREVLAMIEAMQSGTGSLSTTHAESAEGALGKLVTCAMKAGAHVTQDYAVRAIAGSLDVIVHVDVRTERAPASRTEPGFRKTRWTSEIAVLGPGEREKGYAFSSIFRCPPGSTSIVAAGGLPVEYRGLAAYGFDLSGYISETEQAAS